MENAATVHRCCFRWDIYNPFLTWQKLQATFHHGSPTVTQWKATLQPMDRGCTYWIFGFCLEFDEWFKHRYEIPADSVVINIDLNGKTIRRKEVRPCYFCKANWYTYYLPASALMLPALKPHHLVIKFEISLPGDDVGNGLFFNEGDLRSLSSDMKKLLNDRKSSNEFASKLILKSRDHPDPIKVHHYIIDARWDNFIDRHDFDPSVQNTVNIDIFHDLLMDILNYMYSGTFRMSWQSEQNSDLRKATYISELFHVIDQYKLYDLHKAFVNDLQQERVTRNHVLVENRLFKLGGVKDIPINNCFYTWHIYPNPEYEFIFTIRVSNDNRNGPWVSYSLQSKSPFRAYVQVNLDVKKVTGIPCHRAEAERLPFHGQDYSLDMNETVESNYVLFLGCPEVFGSERLDIQYFIRCFLNITNGTTGNEIRAVHVPALQNDLERLNALSNDMFKMKMRKRYTDYKLKSRLNVDTSVYLYHLHKDIMLARAPDLDRMLVNITHEDPRKNMPEVQDLRHKTISFVLDYIYTGKVFPIPRDLLDEVEYFAGRVSCSSLLDLVGRIRLLGLI